MRKILCLLISIFLLFNANNVFAEDDTDYTKLGISFQQQRLANIQNQIILNQSYIAEINGKTSYLSKEIEKLDNYMLEIQENLDILNEEISKEDAQLDAISNSKKERVENFAKIKEDYEKIKSVSVGSLASNNQTKLTASEIKQKTSTLVSLSQGYVNVLKIQNDSIVELNASETLSTLASSSKKEEKRTIEQKQEVLSQQQEKKVALLQQYYQEAENVDSSTDDLEIASIEVEKAIKKLQSLGYKNSVNIIKGKGVLGYPCRSGRLTSDYGYRIHPISGKKKFHAGIDIGGNPVGTPVLASANGIVITAGWLSGYGNTVIIDHGNKISTLYGHNSRLSVKVGDVVTKGQKIAEVGSTGNSTGPHIHFEVRVDGKHTDPKEWL